MRIAALIAAGSLLGVVSRVDERSDAFGGVSSHALWLATAFAAGVLAARSVRGGAFAGAAVLTVANLAYYAWIAATEPGTGLAAVAGPPLQWLVLGVASGAPLGVAGRVARDDVRAVALLVLVVLGDALGMFDAIIP